MATRTGNGLNNTLIGTAFADSLFGLGGNDVLNGLAGNDTLNGGAGNDILNGGTGADTARFTGLFDTFSFVFISPTSFRTSSAVDGTDTLSGIEKVSFGNNAAYTVKLGTNAANTLTGTLASELILGFNGNDGIKSNGGNDLIAAGAGNDKVDAGAGNDRILHNVSQNIGFTDSVVGGIGTDTLVLQVTHAQMNALVSNGVITAFNASNHALPFNFGNFGLPFAMKLVVSGVEALQFVPPSNVAPTVNNDLPNITEDQKTFTGNVFSNDADADGDKLSVTDPKSTSIFFGALNIGTLTLAANGSYSVNLNGNADKMNVSQAAGATLNFHVSDNFTTKTETLMVTINGVNDAPTAAVLNNQSMNEYQVIGTGNGYNGDANVARQFTLSKAAILGTVTDADDPSSAQILGILSDPINYTVVSQTPSLVTLKFTDANAVKINALNAGQHLDFSITASISDPHGGHLTNQHFTLTINGQSDINGTAGNDWVDYTPATPNPNTASSLYGGFDTNPVGITIPGVMGSETIHGLAGLDFLYGDVNYNRGTLHQGGNDTLFGDSEDDLLFGEAYENSTGATIQTAGIDFLDGGSENDGLFGDVRTNNGTLNQAGNDNLFGREGNDQLYGDVGDNTGGTLNQAGNDNLWGGLGDDTLSGDVYTGPAAVIGGNDEIDGGGPGGGVDTVYYLGVLQNFTFAYVGENDGAGHHDATSFQINDSTGHETNNISAPGYDTLTQIDQIMFDSDNLAPITYSLVLGTNGDDTLTGSLTSRDLILGFGGNDSLTGDVETNSDTDITTSHDVLVGGEGNDSLYGDVQYNSGLVDQAGNDILFGQNGTDNLWGDAYENSVDATINTAGDDTLNGGADDDFLYGDVMFNYGTVTQTGQDVLIGGGGDDWFYGDVGAGIKAVTGRDDELDGGDGTADMAFYISTLSEATFTYLGANGTGLGGVLHDNKTFQITTPGEGTDTLTGIEQILFDNNISFNPYTLVLGTNNSNSSLTGTQDASSTTRDLILGFGNNDNLIGDILTNNQPDFIASDDVLVGGADQDFLFGDVIFNYGTDTQAGQDVLIGGGGDDSFYGDVASQTKAVVGGNDELDGGDDIDTAFYLSTLSEVTFTYLGANGTGLAGVLHNNKTFQITAPGEGTDTLTRVEQVMFDSDNSLITYTLVLGTNTNNAFLLLGTQDANSTTQDLILGFGGNDILIGDVGINNQPNFIASNDVILGGSGSNTLIGDILTNNNSGTQAGDDVLIGGDEIDQFFGDVSDGTKAVVGGNDELDGGGDIDKAVYLSTLTEATFTYLGANGTGLGDVVHDNTTFQITAPGEGTDTLTRIEQVQFTLSPLYFYTLVLGTNGDNFLLLGTQTTQNLILGFVGADLLIGDVETNTLANITTSNDALVGGTGGDVLVGDVRYNDGSIQTAGKDILIGGDGNDYLYGDVESNNTGGSFITAGNDYLYGGDGNDYLFGDVYIENGIMANEGSDVLFGGAGDDFLQGGGILNFIGARDYFVYDLSNENGTDTINGYYPSSDDDTLVFLGVTDVVGGGNGVTIDDVLALTSVVDNGGGFAQLRLFSDIGGLDPQGIVNLNRAFNPAGPQNTHSGTEITDYIDEATDIMINQMPIV